MKTLTLALAATALTFGLGGAANATIVYSAASGGSIYTGPTPTYDFDSVATTPVTSPAGTTPGVPGGPIIVGGSQANLFAQPLGSTGNFFSAGPSTTDPSTVLLNGLGDIFNISFIWGSLDSYNTLTFTDAAGHPLGAGYSFTGSQIAALIPAIANGNQTANDTNPIVTFTFSGGDESLVRGMQLFSNGTNAFEIDNIAVNAVPEPATWAMMLIGFGAIGLGMRRRKATQSALPQIA